MKTMTVALLAMTFIIITLFIAFGLSTTGISTTGPDKFTAEVKSSDNRQARLTKFWHRKQKSRVNQFRSATPISPNNETEWQRSDYNLIQPGELDQMSINLETDQSVFLFRLRIPGNAKALYFEVEELPVPVTIFGSSAQHMTSIEDAEFDSLGELDLLVNRFDYSAPLQGHSYFLAVVIDEIDVESLMGMGILDLELNFKADMIRTRVDARLQMGDKQSLTIETESGGFRTFEIEVPDGIDEFRIDLNGAQADLDFSVRSEFQIVDTDQAANSQANMETREFLVINDSSVPPISASKIFVDVYSAYPSSETNFDIFLTEGSQAPEPLLALPTFSDRQNARERALAASIQIATQTGLGSGTIVSPDGLILTNHHVVAEAMLFGDLLNDENEGQLAIAVSTDFSKTPVEHFKGRVVESIPEHDLALVKIESGYYDQEIPDDYEFPFAPCRIPNTGELGQPLTIVGYPLTGGVENDPTLTLTDGLVSGFIQNRYIKTDGDIAGGNSGGGAFDKDWNLIGIPSMNMEDQESGGPAMGILMSLELIQDNWRLDIQN